jgi:hypothetical protein
MNETDKIIATQRDIVRVLQYVIDRTQIETTDGIRAAMARLCENLITDQERDARRLSYLKNRRGDLLPQRHRTLDRKRHLDSVVAQLDAELAQPELNRGEALRIEKERFNAKRPADQADAAYVAVINELAAIESEIASLSKQEVA